MTRPIVWALGTLGMAALSATATSDRLAARFGLSAQTPHAAAVHPPESQTRTMAISADLRGHFIVHPTLDGRRVRMLVDTGASLVTLSHEDAQLAGIRVSGRDFTRAIATANGTVQAAPVRIREMRVGDIVVYDVEALVLPQGRLGTSLLGMSFLRRLGGFEISQGRLTLRI
jgi:aspartyl protease family protein